MNTMLFNKKGCRWRSLSLTLETILAALSMSLIACEGPPPAKTTPASRPTPVQKSICYFGDTIAYKPDGTKLGGIKTLVRLSLKPEEKKIIQDIVNFDPRPGTPNRFQTLHLTTQGDRFSLAETNNALQGKGRFLGTDPPWHRWKYEAKLMRGGRLEAEVSLDSKTLRERKTLFSESGEETVSFRMNLDVIPKNTCREYWKQAKGRDFLTKKNSVAPKKSAPPSPPPSPPPPSSQARQ